MDSDSQSSFSVLSNPPFFFPSLPGAWPSESTLSLHETPVEGTGTQGAVPPLAPSEGDGFIHRVVLSRTGQRVSVATFDSESVRSDDFYSFISQYDEDEDATVLADHNDLKINPVEETKDAASILHAFEPENGHIQGDHKEEFCQSPTDTTASSSEEALSSFELSTYVGGSDTSPSSEQSKILLDSNPCSPQIFLKASKEDGGRTPRTAVLSSSPRQSSILSESLSTSASAHFGDEESSQDLDQSEDDSAVSYARVYNLIDQPDFSNDSEESFSLPMPSPPPHRVRRSLQGHRPVERQESDLDINHLSQPDGDNPWTLSLEPALINLSGFASSSRASVSVESSSVVHDEPPFVPPASHVQSPISTARPSFATSRNDLGSRVGLGRPSVDAPPLATPHHHVITAQNPAQKTDVMQKTKSLYQKMKRFFTPKSSRQGGSSGISNNMITGSSPEVGSPVSPYSSPYFQESSSQWSLRAFQRAAKSSAPSVAGSYTQEGPLRSPSHRSGRTEESRHTFDHSRSLPTEHIRPPSRRGRRFSVPTPLSLSLSKRVGPPSSARNASTIRRSYQKDTIHTS